MLSISCAGANTSANLWAQDVISAVNERTKLDMVYRPSPLISSSALALDLCSQVLASTSGHGRSFSSFPQPPSHRGRTARSRLNVQDARSSTPLTARTIDAESRLSACQLPQYRQRNSLRLPDMVKRLLAAPSCLSPSVGDDLPMDVSAAAQSSGFLCLREDEVKPRRPLRQLDDDDPSSISIYSQSTMPVDIPDSSFVRRKRAPAKLFRRKRSPARPPIALATRGVTKPIASTPARARQPPLWVSIDTDAGLPRRTPRRQPAIALDRDFSGHELVDRALHDRTTITAAEASASEYSTIPSASILLTASERSALCRIEQGAGLVSRSLDDDMRRFLNGARAHDFRSPHNTVAQTHAEPRRRFDVS